MLATACKINYISFINFTHRMNEDGFAGCYQCNKLDHDDAQCTSNIISTDLNDEGFAGCYRCNKLDHDDSECKSNTLSTELNDDYQ